MNRTYLGVVVSHCDGLKDRELSKGKDGKDERRR